MPNILASKSTPERYASIINDFIKKRVNIKLKDFQSNTLLNCILDKIPFEKEVSSYIKIIKLLIEKGINVNFKGRRVITLLHIAAHRHNNFEIVKFLVENGADINAEDSRRIIPLMYRTLFREEKIALYLLKSGANPFFYLIQGNSFREEVHQRFTITGDSVISGSELTHLIDVLLQPSDIKASKDVINYLNKCVDSSTKKEFFCKLPCK